MIVESINSDEIPMFFSVPAGFASPAEDHLEERLNLNSYLLKKSSSSIIYVSMDNSMYESGITVGDILIIDKSCNNPLSKIVLCNINGETFVKRFSKIKGDYYLTADSLAYPPIKLDESLQYSIIGVVHYSIHSLLSQATAHQVPEEGLDIQKFIVKNPVSTFFVRASGHSMIKAGIFDKDILVVDRSIEVSADKIVIAHIDGGFTVKRLKKKKVSFILFPENEDFPSIELNEEMDPRFWGVVTYSIHKVV